MSKDLAKDCEKVLFSGKELKQRIASLATHINVTYKYRDNCPLVIGILKGCLHFYSELTRKLYFPHESAFMSVSTYYGGRESTGKLQITQELNCSVAGRDVLIVEDIIDSGITLAMLKELFLKQGANSVTIVTMLDKECRRKVDIRPDYCAFTIDDYFVVGYGLDYKELYRNLPFIGILKEEVYTE